MSTEKKQFQSESKRLLDLMINSIYTHKEIFLREIISNSSDAIDKLYFISLTDDKVGLNRDDFKIKIDVDKDARTITVSDNGIGMDEADLEKSLGTIASSGTYAFKQEQLADSPAQSDGDSDTSPDVSPIGQFGVGFYSAFMVASKVTVLTKKYGSPTAYKWESEGADGYTIEETDKDTVGTQVILTLKEDTEEENYSDYLQQYKLSALVSKYSDYIHYPIIMKTEHQRAIPADEKSDDDDIKYETVTEDEVLNSMVPLWQRPKKDVTQEEYNEFYKQKFYDYDDPMHVISTSVEGVVTYKALLFIPNRVPYNYYTKEYKRGLKLYSSGVLIMDNCEELLPEHFGFVRGVVDSQDLSLNISREMLQHDRQLKIIATNIEKKIKNELTSMLTNDREKYEKFYANFGRQIKFGAVGDYGAHKDTVKDLLLFYSSTQKKLVTLKEYTERMGEEQKEIYFATGESIDAIDKLPQIEDLRDSGAEILYCPEQIDEFCLSGLSEYEDKPFKNIVNEDVSESGDKDKDDNSEDDSALKFIKDVLGDRVNEVVYSKRLKSHAVCLTAKGGISFEMEKYMAAAQPEAHMKAQRVLEINAAHPAVNALIANITADKEKAEKYAQLLYSQAVLTAGLQLEDPAKYAALVCELMAAG